MERVLEEKKKKDGKEGKTKITILSKDGYLDFFFFLKNFRGLDFKPG